jgi:hypothetical protein
MDSGAGGCSHVSDDPKARAKWTLDDTNEFQALTIWDPKYPQHHTLLNTGTNLPAARQLNASLTRQLPQLTTTSPVKPIHAIITSDTIGTYLLYKRTEDARVDSGDNISVESQNNTKKPNQKNTKGL